jgi:L-alanine-DL-glutamate epimerase-like enolase superfamily enzyme
LEYFGIKGYGEASAIAYYDVTIEKMIAELEAKRKMIESYVLQDPKRFWHFLHHLMPTNNFLICALDMAAWDIYGKMQRKPLYQVWNLDYSNNVLTDYTIGMDTPEKMVEKMEANPWPIYKVKMGWQNDIEMIEALRKKTDKPIRVDVNSGWSVEDAKIKISKLKDFGIEFIEEPIERFNYNGMKLLKPFATMPLIADESCVQPKDVDICATCFDGINIKLTKCGGITPALEMIENAKKQNLKVMIGCMNESTIGSAAIAHLLPMLDYVDMDGPLLLSKDIATGLQYDYGKISISNEPGLGITFTGLIN